MSSDTPQSNSSFTETALGDAVSGLVVFLVAIPLCLGISLASGAPALSGVIAGIVGGLVVTLFSNSALGVSGPAAGLVAIVEPAIQQLGFQNFLIAVSLAGVIQFLLGCCRAGTIGYYFPTAVIKGMLVAIGLIIILKQIPHAFGYDKDYEGDLTFQQADGYNTFSEIGHALTLITPAAVVISTICLAILILWETKFVKGFRFTSLIQGPLVAVIAGVLLFLGFESVESMRLDREHLVSLPVTMEITTPYFDRSRFAVPARKDPNNAANENVTKPKDKADVASASGSHAQLPASSDETLDSDEFGGRDSTVGSASVSSLNAIFRIIIVAMTLAIVASLESLLCAEATDRLDPKRRQTDLNQELRAQGVGNIASGLLGGLPVTQVIVRSSANIQSGGQTRFAAFIHGVLLLVCVLLIPHILNMIPLASLASILLIVGYKLAHPTKFIAMYKLGWTQFLPFVITIIAIVMTDLLIGIGIGLVASLFFILKDSYVKSHWMSESEEGGRTVYRMTLAERVFFINKGSILASLQKVQPGSKLVVDASDTVHIDQDVIDLINDFETSASFNRVEFERVALGTEAKREAEPARITRNRSMPGS